MTAPQDQKIQHFVVVKPVTAERRHHRRRDDVRSAARGFARLAEQGESGNEGAAENRTPKNPARYTTALTLHHKT